MQNDMHIYDTDEKETIVCAIQKIQNKQHLEKIYEIIIKNNKDIKPIQKKTGIEINFTHLKNNTYGEIEEYLENINNSSSDESESNISKSSNNSAKSSHSYISKDVNKKEIEINSTNLKLNNHEKNIIKKRNYHETISKQNSELNPDPNKKISNVFIKKNK